MANYSFVIDNSFQPFSMQEMLVPFSAYKDSFEKSEEQYNDLSDKADKFKYLSETLPEGSRSREIYENYANELKNRAEDLAHNGLTMGNRRALTSLKRRYSGEIGRLMKADEAMTEERKLRQAMGAQDSSLLYSTDNLNIDDFLDGKNPNLYRVSGNELYSRGAAAGKAASSRVFKVNGTEKTLGGMYLDFAQAVGYDPAKMRAFAENAANIPELAMQVDSILEEKGVLKNLSGDNLRRARQSVINGMFDGAVYSESHNPQRDLNALSAAEKAQLDMQQKQFNLSKSQLERQYMGMGFRLDDKGRPYRDEQLVKDIIAMKQAGKGKSGTSTSSNSGQGTIAKNAIKITWNGDTDKSDFDKNDIKTERFKDDDAIVGNASSYDDLPQFIKDKVDNYSFNGDPYDYNYFYRPYKRGTFDDDEATVIMIPIDKRVKDNDPMLDMGIY